MKPDEKKYLVVYSIMTKLGDIDEACEDHYEVFHNIEDAKEKYKQVLDYDDLYSANLSQVLESTD